MPWQERTTMSIRRELVSLAEQPQSNVPEPCRRYGISPKTAYKWLQRYHEQGNTGPQGQSRRPLPYPGPSSPELRVGGGTAASAVSLLGGAQAVELAPDGIRRPHRSTVDTVLRRHGCQVRYHAEEAPTPATHRFEHSWPNELWQMDFNLS